MSNNKESNENETIQAILVGVTFLFFWMFLDLTFWSSVGWTFLIAFILIGVFILSKQSELKDEKRKLTDLLSKNIDEHHETLLRKKSTLIYRGEYGEVDRSGWNRELNKFIRIIIPSDNFKNIRNEMGEKKFLEFIKKQINENLRDYDIPNFIDEQINEVQGMDGVEYEILCELLFENNGWNVQRTNTTGDQGIDLIASKNGLRLAVQCKRYTGNVGNKAVQEAYSGKKFYDADAAVVITNSFYTKSARTLSQKLDVLLLHHDDIDDLEITSY